MFNSGANVVREISSDGTDAAGAGFDGVVVVDAGAPPPLEHAAVATLTASNPRRISDGINFIVRSPRCCLEIHRPMTSSAAASVPAVGDRAPDFTLPSTSGEKLTLSSLRGKPVLLAFFPLAFSSTCTEELCEMRDDYEKFESRNVLVLPISVDHTYSLKEYKAKYNMKVDMLSDFRRDVSRLYGVLHDERFYAKRAYFLVGEDGVIQWEHVEDNPGNRRADAELLAAIDAVGG